MSRNRVLYKMKDLFLLGDADLTERGGGNQNSQRYWLNRLNCFIALSVCRKTHGSCFVGMAISCSDSCKGAPVRSLALCAPLLGSHTPPTRSACDGLSFSKSLEANNWMSARFPSLAL